eukprot:1464789-Amphidinium_carterae.1
MNVPSSDSNSSPVATGEHEVILPHSGRSLVIVEGAGRGKKAGAPSSSSSLPVQHTNLEADDPEDLLPLSCLVQASSPLQAAQTADLEVSEDDDCSTRSVVVFEGKFQNGRTLYSQVLWPEMTWHEAQLELNRDVRRKLSLWCMCVGDIPVDPSSRVPQAKSPFDRIIGSLKRLTDPLDYTTLRGMGGLCTPPHPTVTGREGTPFAEVYPGEANACRLVDEAYDTSSSSPGEVPAVENEGVQCISNTSSSSSSSSIYVLSERSDPSSEHCLIDDSPTSSSSLIMIVGAGKLHRVQHESIVAAAIERLTGDFKLTAQGLLVEHKCIAHIMRADTHAAKAVFQAQTVKQRYVAFSAALARAGLSDFAKGIASAASQMNTDEVSAQATQPEATSDPYIEVPAKKRGRPKRDEAAVPGPSTKAAGPDPVEDSDRDFLEMKALHIKVSQLEKWAHGVDRTLASSTSRSSVDDSDERVEDLDRDIPPTIDYEATQEQAIVPKRIAAYERLAAAQADPPNPSWIQTRLLKLEDTLKDLTALFVDDPAIMFRELNNNVDKLNEFATAASEQLQRTRIFNIGDPLPQHLSRDQQPEKHLGWRLHMIEKSLSEHVDAAQVEHNKYRDDIKDLQTRVQRHQAENDSLRKQMAKYDQTLNILLPWMANLTSKFQENATPAAPHGQSVQHLHQVAALQQVLHHQGLANAGNFAQPNYAWPQPSIFPYPMPQLRQVSPLPQITPIMPTPPQCHTTLGQGMY